MIEYSVSNSEIQTFKRCRRKWWLTYVLGWGVDPMTVSPVGVMHLGTRIHTALEAYYGYGVDPIVALEFIYDNETDRRPEYSSELDKEKSWAVTMVKGYLDWSAEEGLDDGITVVATEKVVSVPISLPALSGTTVNVVGKLDQIVHREVDGMILSRDWKTVGTLNKANLLVLDEQARTYNLLLHLTTDQLDYRAEGIFYTMLLRSKRTAKATGPFYQQIEQGYNHEDRMSMLLRLRGVLTDMMKIRVALDDGADHREVAYLTSGDHCSWGCPYTTVCPLFDDGSRAEAAMHRNFSKQNPYDYYGTDLIDRVIDRFKPVDKGE